MPQNFNNVIVDVSLYMFVFMRCHEGRQGTGCIIVLPTHRAHAAWQVLPRMHWWDEKDLSGAGKLLIEQGLGSPPAYSLWEVETALRAAHLLISQTLCSMYWGEPSPSVHVSTP